MSEPVRHALLILFVLACYVLVGSIDRRVAEDEASVLLDFTIESRADDIAPQPDSLRLVELPLHPSSLIPHPSDGVAPER